MPLFSKRKIYELEDVSALTDAERDTAIFELEKRRYEINTELESVMAAYSRLTGKRIYRRRKFKMGRAPNDYKPEKR